MVHEKMKDLCVHVWQESRGIFWEKENNEQDQTDPAKE